MTSRTEIEQAFLAADTAGNTEDAQFFSDELLKLDSIDAAKDVSSTFGEDISNFGLEAAAAANRGAVGLLDIPPMLFNAVSSLAGSDQRASMVTDLPILSEATEGNFMEDGVAKGAVRVAGEVLGGSVLPVAATMKRGDALLKSGKTIVGSNYTLPVGSKALTPTMAETAARAPSQFLRKEATDAALFAGGAATGSSLSENDPLFEILGGLGAVTRGAPIKMAMKAGGAGSETVKQMFSKKAQRMRAAELIKQHASDPDKALATLRKSIKQGKTGTLSQMSNDAGIAGLEKQMIREGGDDFAVRVAESDAALNDALITRMDKLGGDGEGVFREHLQSTIRGATNKINNVVQNSVKKAKHSAQIAGTPLAPADASRAFKDEWDEGFKKIREIEDDAWSKVPSELKTQTATMKSAITNLQKNLTPTARRDIAEEIAKPTRLIKELDSTVSPKELADLRGSILATKRSVQDTASANALKQLDDMQRVIGDTIDAIDDSASYRAATAITKEKHKLFNDGLFAKAARNSTPEDIGEKLLRAGGSGGPLADDVITVADKFNINLSEASEDMIKAAFIKSTANADGTLNTNDIQRFMQKHQNLLTRFPKVAKGFKEAAAVQELADQSIKLGNNATRNLERSKSHLYSEFDDPVKAIQSAVNSRDQKAAFRWLVRAAKKDPSGAALKGFRRDVIDHALSKVSSETVKGSRRIKPTFRAQLEKARPGYEEVLSKKELKRLDKIVKEIDRFFLRSKVPASQDKEVVAVLPIALGQIAGARIGARLGTTPLIAAGLGRRFAESQLSKIPKLKAMGMVEDMILNPMNFSQYADEIMTVKNADEAYTALRSWLISSGVYTAKELEDQEQANTTQ